MSLKQRHNINVRGDGPATMIFAHGFGCDQNMWRFLAPVFEENFRVILFDLVGSGNSDISAYDFDRYSSLQTHADDALEIIDEFAEGPVIFVGHSVSATIALLATNKAPERFAAQVMVGPSPCYIDDGEYIGGFTRSDIEDLIQTMESNYLGWSSTMAPAIMGAPAQPELAAELTNSFCRTDPKVARHFAKVTFLSDHRADLPKSTVPTLILQCSDDIIAPICVGEYMQRTMQNAVMTLIDNVGHCPHMSAPHASTAAIQDYLKLHVS